MTRCLLVLALLLPSLPGLSFGGPQVDQGVRGEDPKAGNRFEKICLHAYSLLNEGNVKKGDIWQADFVIRCTSEFSSVDEEVVLAAEKCVLETKNSYDLKKCEPALMQQAVDMKKNLGDLDKIRKKGGELLWEAACGQILSLLATAGMGGDIGGSQEALPACVKSLRAMTRKDADKASNCILDADDFLQLQPCMEQFK